MNKILVLKNPELTARKSEEMHRNLKEFFGEEALLNIHTVESFSRAEVIVRRQIGEGIDLCIAAGGDSTIATAAGGLAGSDVPLGIIPLGTGNMIARELGIPLQMEKAIGVISGSHRTRTIDAMKVGERIFVLTVGAGVSSLAVKALTRREKKLFGMLAYVGSALRQLITFRPHRFKITVDGRYMEIRSPEVSVANGGIISEMILPRSPRIEIDDGVLDVIYVKADSIKDYPTLILNVLGRKPPQRSIKRIGATDRITIDAEKPIKVQADGEMVGETPVSVELIPGAFRVIVPV